ncbi:MAG TPA: nucleotide exchange factor GrpE [Caulobacteraceae bacterium]|jgi:molecular chaperone GrpE|nr:nucleotide exchange factor GrpE [Caulobacteraceae bacterium]
MTDDTTPADHEDAAQDAEVLKLEVEALKEQVLRYAAEAENTKRRAEREANDARAYAIQRFANDLLGVADNLARARAHAPADAADPAVKNLAVGLEMTEKDLLAAFERNGLKRVDPPRGAKFDPHQHQAVMERTADDVGPGAVLEVLQAGYDLYGRIVRPAMVVVSAKGSTGAAPAEPAAANPYAHADGDDAGGAIDEKA